MPVALLALVLALSAPMTGSAAGPPTFQELEESLTCQCGCGLTVHSCNHLQCPSALPLRQELREQMTAGRSRDEVLRYFADKYGEKILSSPTTSGFNLTAWVMPFAALLVGALIVSVTLVRWRGGRREMPAAGPTLAPVDAAGTSPYEKILERELKQLDS